MEEDFRFPKVYKYDYDKNEYYLANLSVPDHDHYHRVYISGINDYDIYEDIYEN